jgi:hypothetical protein
MHVCWVLYIDSNTKRSVLTVLLSHCISTHPPPPVFMQLSYRREKGAASFYIACWCKFPSCYTICGVTAVFTDHRLQICGDQGSFPWWKPIIISGDEFSLYQSKCRFISYNIILDVNLFSCRFSFIFYFAQHTAELP